MVTQLEILEQLDKLKQKERGYFKPKDYKEFLPSAIPNMPKKGDTTLFTAHMQSIMDRSDAATQTAIIKAENRRQYQAMREAQRRLKAAQQAFQGSQNSGGGKNYYSYVGGGGGNISGSGTFRDPTPFRIGSGIGTYNWRGRNLTVNRSMANNFIGFLNALTRTGYKIHSLGSYANRNIAGTNTLSLHARGLAIDINPAQNPVTYGHIVTNLPRGVGRLAAKYGLVWGGNWNGPKFDTMHFSRPYGGTK